MCWKTKTLALNVIKLKTELGGEQETVERLTFNPIKNSVNGYVLSISMSKNAQNRTIAVVNLLPVSFFFFFYFSTHQSRPPNNWFDIQKKKKTKSIRAK